MMTSELNELKKVGLAQEDTLQEVSTKLDTLSSIDSKIVICDTGSISGSVSVDNFPSEYPLPDTQISDLKNITVTNTPLDVNVTNTSLTVTGDVTITGSNIAYDSTNDVLKVSIDVDNVGLAKESTLSSIDSKIVKCDTDNVTVVSEKAYDSANDLKKVSIERDNVGIAKESTLSSINSNIDVALSTRASESTLSGIKTQTDNLTFVTTGSGKSLYVHRGGEAYKYQVRSQGYGGYYDSGVNASLIMDTTDYSFTNTGYSTITYFRSREWGSEYGLAQFGTWTYVKGDGTNTVYVRVVLADGTIISEKSTTSSTAVWLYFHYPYRRKFVDWRNINVQCKVSGGTGYLYQVNHRVVVEWPLSLVLGRYDEKTYPPIKVDSDGTQHVNITKSIAYDSSNDRFKVGVENFPSWFTSSTTTTDTIDDRLDSIQQYFARIVTYEDGKAATVYASGRGPVFWSDGTDYSFTNTSYSVMTYCDTQGKIIAHVGVSTEIKGDGTNTVYCKVTDRAGHVLYEWSTTSSSAVRVWREGFIAYWAFPDFNRINISCKVDSGTGYLTNVYATMPSDNHNLIMGWNWDYSYPDAGIYPVRVDGSGYLHVKALGYNESTGGYYVPRMDANNYLVTRDWKEWKEPKVATSSFTVIGGGSKTVTLYDGRAMLVALFVTGMGAGAGEDDIAVKDGGTTKMSFGSLYEFTGFNTRAGATYSHEWGGTHRWDTTNDIYAVWRKCNTVHSSDITITITNSSSSDHSYYVQAIYIPY